MVVGPHRAAAPNGGIPVKMSQNDIPKPSVSFLSSALPRCNSVFALAQHCVEYNTLGSNTFGMISTPTSTAHRNDIGAPVRTAGSGEMTGARPDQRLLLSFRCTLLFGAGGPAAHTAPLPIRRQPSSVLAAYQRTHPLLAWRASGMQDAAPEAVGTEPAAESTEPRSFSAVRGRLPRGHSMKQTER
jgi:hypothetical protein